MSDDKKGSPPPSIPSDGIQVEASPSIPSDDKKASPPQSDTDTDTGDIIGLHRIYLDRAIESVRTMWREGRPSPPLHEAHLDDMVVQFFVLRDMEWTFDNFMARSCHEIPTSVTWVQDNGIDPNVRIIEMNPLRTAAMRTLIEAYSKHTKKHIQEYRALVLRAYMTFSGVLTCTALAHAISFNEGDDLGSEEDKKALLALDDFDDVFQFCPSDRGLRVSPNETAISFARALIHEAFTRCFLVIQAASTGGHFQLPDCELEVQMHHHTSTDGKEDEKSPRRMFHMIESSMGLFMQNYEGLLKVLGLNGQAIASKRITAYVSLHTSSNR